MIVTGYKSHVGGVETVNEILINIFRDAGLEVEIFSAEEILNRTSISFLDKVLVKVIGLPYITAKEFKSNNAKFDLVICNGEFSFGINHEKCINFFHGTSYGYYQHLKKALTLKQKISLLRFDFLQRLGSRKKYIVTVSNFTKEILESRGIAVNRVINNSVNTEQFKPTDSEKEGDLLAVGSLAYKGYAKGFDIIEKINRKKHDVTCITNSEPYKNANWIQFVPNSEMPEIYNRYKILLFPSRFEACQMVPLEAMACGLPVVVSNVGIGNEIKELLPDFVCDELSEESYINKINKINTDYHKYSYAARKLVMEKFNFNDFKAEWLGLVKEILDNGMENSK